jgi:hypothetical protein
MKLMELASPFGVFILGVVVLSVGYVFYVIGLGNSNASLRDLGIPAENLGITLMGASIVLYILAHAANQALKD